ncbi:adenylate/guanylate cyclase domain-containing protein [Mycolicibacterium septicum]|uniref:adenylate/guanylate cyclase domain-containing protein n=1 Tax=Mycolicibacterium septicum TaxID=98668 RepID=UPI00235DE35E|nr:adenylate/guanylate cyclase domain-containing protein [Mycolicibacterium septicum]
MARYTGWLAVAHLLTAAEVTAVAVALSGHTTGRAPTLTSEKNVLLAAALVGVSTVAVILSGVAILGPSLRWFAAGQQPDPAQRHSVVRIVRRQMAALAVIWVAIGVVALVANFQVGISATLLLASMVLFGAAAATSTGVLFTQRTLRPVLAAAYADYESHERVPGVVARMALMWTVHSGLPALAIVAIIALRSMGWIIEKNSPVEIPIVALSLVSVLIGLRAMLLGTRSISDPVRDVIEAMADVERGRLDSGVSVYEQSEIGRLQRGFNRMVAGLRERDRLRDLFGRHVGVDVVRLAIAQDETLAGDVRDVAVLFIDLVGSTELASTRPPLEVADALNDFFRIVVAAVDERHGLINKFQGDAALAVFGAPLRTDNPASDALATARSLAAKLDRLRMLDFGIGVSAGPVFAGNIGAENRYEYTVIGDAVNEAARLADVAKTVDGRILCSGAAVEAADATESRRWDSRGSVLLRGRSATTAISVPRDH